MPKRSSTSPPIIVRFEPEMPFPAHRWLTLLLDEVVVLNREFLGFRFSLPDRPADAGRIVEYPVRAVLRDNSPLACFLATAFSWDPGKKEDINLSILIGRCVQCQFAKSGPDGTQPITHWRPVPATAAAPLSGSARLATTAEPADRPATTAKPASTPAATASAAQTAKPAGPPSAMSPPATTPSGVRATAASAGAVPPTPPASPVVKGVNRGL